MLTYARVSVCHNVELKIAADVYYSCSAAWCFLELTAGGKACSGGDWSGGDVRVVCIIMCLCSVHWCCFALVAGLAATEQVVLYWPNGEVGL